MRSHQASTALLLCAVTALLAGCGAAPEPTVAVVSPPTTPEPAEADPPAEEPPAPAVQPSRPREASYRPPFPGRTELFSPPANARRAARRSDGDFEESVELVGFGGINEEHVVLLIDGVMTPVKLGDKRHDVQVISIQRPLAVLQRGRTRWTASLE